MGHDPQRRTLARRLEDRDRSRFTGRQGEIAFLRKCLEDDDPPASVVHICGPGGIGKSTLLRETARSGRALGRTVIALDGRELGPAPERLEAAMREAAGEERPLILLDSYERMTALDSYLRRDLLPSLPGRAVVVTASRLDPDVGWFSGGWEAVTARLDLGALAPDEARLLLAAHGLADGRVPAIIDWAHGSPLALALAADAATADAGWSVTGHPDRPDIVRSLLLRLVETELGGVRPSALGVAVVARTTTPELLRAVLPGGSANSPSNGPVPLSEEAAMVAYRELAGLTITEQLATGITVHELARKALLADLRQRNPQLERDLRRRIFDYLYARARHEPALMIDMAHLVENPLLRWGFGWDGNAEYRIDSVRPGDADRIAPGQIENRLWWQLTRQYFDLAPDRVAIARDRDEQICGYLVCMSLATAPAFAADEPLAGPWLAHARTAAGLGESVFWQAAVDMTGTGQVQAMLGIAGMLRCGAASPRFAYLPIDTRVAGAAEFAAALGAEHLTDLDRDLGDGVAVQCHRLDYGPGGIFSYMRAQLYAELGLSGPGEPAQVQPARGQSALNQLARNQTAPNQPAHSQPAPGQLVPDQPARRQPAAREVEPAPMDVETVREALKGFRVPRDLARSPLASGRTQTERAESVRQLIRAGAAAAFGDSENERLLLRVLTAGYLEPATSHEAAANRLSLSRAAYFRRLRTAVERLAEYLAQEPADARPGAGEHPFEVLDRPIAEDIARG
ncbi:MAG TPA: hypothetical protein VGI58_07550 [Streptosporangiaceae bacterium]